MSQKHPLRMVVLNKIVTQLAILVILDLILAYLLIQHTAEQRSLLPESIESMILGTMIVVLTVIPIFVLLYFSAYRHLMRILTTDRADLASIDSASLIPEDKIPANEIGEIMKVRNQVLLQLQRNRRFYKNLFLSGNRLSSLVGELVPMETLLNTGIEELRVLIGAQYGCVLVSDGGQVQHFAYSGVTDEEVNRIGVFPEGKGLFALNHDSVETLRLADLSQDPRSIGFPAGHPPMKGLLSVPVLIGRTCWGRLFLTNKTNGEPFTEEDERIATSFAISFAAAINNRQLLWKIKDSEEKYRSTVEAIPLGLAVLDGYSRIRLANKTLCELLELSPEDVPGKNIGAILSRLEPDPQKENQTQTDSPAAPGMFETSRLTFVSPTLGKRRLELTTAQIKSQNDETLLILEDITDQEKAEEIIRHMAFHDALTDLPNRTLFLDRLKQALLMRRRNSRTLCLFILDLDGFKEVNDEFGHPVGDLILQEVARRIQGSVRASDTVGRLGGDEFAILLPDAALEGAKVAATKVLNALKEPFVVDGNTILLGASIGIAEYPEHGTNINHLMRSADSAMYSAKRSREGVNVYTNALG